MRDGTGQSLAASEWKTEGREAGEGGPYKFRTRIRQQGRFGQGTGFRERGVPGLSLGHGHRASAKKIKRVDTRM